jgi:hypothetical protein
MRDEGGSDESFDKAQALILSITLKAYRSFIPHRCRLHPCSFILAFVASLPQRGYGALPGCNR